MPKHKFTDRSNMLCTANGMIIGVDEGQGCNTRTRIPETRAHTHADTHIILSLTYFTVHSTLSSMTDEKERNSFSLTDFFSFFIFGWSSLIIAFLFTSRSLRSI